MLDILIAETEQMVCISEENSDPSADQKRAASNETALINLITLKTYGTSLMDVRPFSSNSYVYSARFSSINSR